MTLAMTKVPTMPTRENITGVILAGGRASRLGGCDKGLLQVKGKALIQWVIDKLKPQVNQIMVNANRNLPEYEALGYPVFDDGNDEFLGPLAGLRQALQHIQTEWAITVPCDTPLLPDNFVAQMLQTLNKEQSDQQLCIAHDGNRLQPVFCLLHRSLQAELDQYIKTEGRKTREWITSIPHVIADFTGQSEAFYNINTDKELARVESILLETN